MARFTLLEVHLDGAQFTANAPFSGEESQEGIEKSIEERIGTESEPSGTSSTSRALRIVLGFVALVGFAAVARRILSGDESAFDEARSEAPIITD